MTLPHGLLIFGIGGHARSVADVALAAGVQVLAFVDAQARDGETFLQFPVQRRWDAPLPPGWAAFAASGKPLVRAAQLHDIFQRGMACAHVLAPDASVGAGSRQADGCFVGRHAHLGPMSRLGRGCIVNTGAVVEHDCAVGDFSHISVNATLAGGSSIGSRCMVGAGATVIDGIRICDDVVIGAGAVVVRDIEHPGTWAGVPAAALHP